MERRNVLAPVLVAALTTLSCNDETTKPQEEPATDTQPTEHVRICGTVRDELFTAFSIDTDEKKRIAIEPVKCMAGSGKYSPQVQTIVTLLEKGDRVCVTPMGHESNNAQVLLACTENISLIEKEGEKVSRKED